MYNIYNKSSQMYNTVSSFISYMKNKNMVLMGHTALSFCYGWSYIFPEVCLCGSADASIEGLIYDWLGNTGLYGEIVDMSYDSQTGEQYYCVELTNGQVIDVSYAISELSPEDIHRSLGYSAPIMSILAYDILTEGINTVTVCTMDYIATQYGDYLEEDWLYNLCNGDFDTLWSILNECNYEDKDSLIRRYQLRYSYYYETN